MGDRHATLRALARNCDLGADRDQRVRAVAALNAVPRREAIAHLAALLRLPFKVWKLAARKHTHNGAKVRVRVRVRVQNR